jgi:hypothetical protein
MPMSRSRAFRGLMVLFLAASWASTAPAQEATGRFLLISDIHFDPFYDGTLFHRLEAEPIERWPAILDASRPAGFNPRGTDSNNALLQGSLDDARRRCPDPDFILYPGDFLAHQWQARYDALAPRTHLEAPGPYRDFTTRVIRFLASEFRRRYPRTPILPTLGNDDSYCGDYRITPDGPFLSMFAEAWGPLLGPEGDRGSFHETFPRGGYYSIPLRRPLRHRLVVLNSVVFSVNYDNSCGTSARTPALDQLRWLDRTLEQAGAAGESVWLLMHIPPGINSFNSAEVVPAGGAPVTFWQPALLSRFLQIIGRHRPALRLAFAGHTHMDDFRVIRSGQAPELLCKIAPAISPIFGNNPGYQVYEYDRTTGAVRDYRTYYLTNLDDRTAGPSGAVAPGRWSLEYRFGEAYGAAAFDAPTIVRLAEAMGNDAVLRQRYTQYYGVSAPPEFNDRTFGVYRCAIGNVTPGEFLRCLTGVPKPRAPLAHPDRIRMRPAADRP